MLRLSPRVTSLLLLGVAAFSWPAMMGLHEWGHVCAAWTTGGTVTRVVWHPLMFSRTDVSPNPSPLVVVWAGPVVGCLLPIVLERLTAWTLRHVVYLVRLFAGFCLIANGAYLGLGGFDHIGDAGDMLRLGTPLWVLLVFGVIATAAGLAFWHLASFRLGFGNKQAEAIPRRDIAVVWIAAVAVNGAALASSFLTQ